jgi:hypothetical protein
MLASERVRDVIERFEPGVHQFLIVDIYPSHRPFESGDAPVSRSYWLVIGQSFDAVSAERTHHPRGVVTFPDGRTQPGNWRFKGDAPVIFDHEVVAGRHLWVDLNFVKTEQPFVSDPLAKVLMEMKLFWRAVRTFRKMDSIDSIASLRPGMPEAAYSIPDRPESILRDPLPSRASTIRS